eukprot:gene7885-16143_t
MSMSVLEDNISASVFKSSLRAEKKDAYTVRSFDNYELNCGIESHDFPDPDQPLHLSISTLNDYSNHGRATELQAVYSHGMPSDDYFVSSDLAFMEKMEIECPSNKIGQLIGSRGLLLKEIHSRTGCILHVDQNVNVPNGAPHIIQLCGTLDQIIKAKDLVNAVIKYGPVAFSNTDESSQSICSSNSSSVDNYENSLNKSYQLPQHSLSYIYICTQEKLDFLNSQNELFKEIMHVTNSQISLCEEDMDDCNHGIRRLLIQGTTEKIVSDTKDMLDSFINNNSYGLEENLHINSRNYNNSLQYQSNNISSYNTRSNITNNNMNGNSSNNNFGMKFYQNSSQSNSSQISSSNINNNSGTKRIEFECPHDKVGIVIGSNGGTIKEIMRRSGARVIINEKFPDGYPRLVEVYGSSTEVAIAKELILDVINKTSNPRNAGGRSHRAVEHVHDNYSKDPFFYPPTTTPYNPYNNASASPYDTSNINNGSNTINSGDQRENHYQTRRPSALLTTTSSSLSSSFPLPPTPTPPPPLSLGETFVECPTDRVSLVIGYKGTVVKEISRRSGAYISVDEIDTGTSMRRVRIRGTRDEVQVALQLVHAVIQEGPLSLGITRENTGNGVGIGVGNGIRSVPSSPHIGSNSNSNSAGSSFGFGSLGFESSNGQSQSQSYVSTPQNPYYSPHISSSSSSSQLIPSLSSGYSYSQTMSSNSHIPTLTPSSAYTPSPSSSSLSSQAQSFPPFVPQIQGLSALTNSNYYNTKTTASLYDSSPSMTSTNSTSNSNGNGNIYTEVISCPAERVGLLIGSKGSTIKEIKKISKASVTILVHEQNNEYPSTSGFRRVLCKGDAQAVEIAKELILNVLSHGAGVLESLSSYASPRTYENETEIEYSSDISNTVITNYMDCPKNKIPVVNGYNGMTLKEIMRRSSADIYFETNSRIYESDLNQMNNNSDGSISSTSRLYFTGRLEDVETAKILVQTVLDKGPGFLDLHMYSLPESTSIPETTSTTTPTSITTPTFSMSDDAQKTSRFFP